MAVQSEIQTAINQIASRRNISPASIMDSIAQSIKSAINRQYGTDVDVDVELDEDGSLVAYMEKEVVEKVENDVVEISQEEAQRLAPDIEIGDKISVEVSFNQFGRIAAQAAKDALLSNVSTAERNAIIEKVKEREGEVLSAKVRRMRGKLALVEVEGGMARLPLEEQIPNEYYKINETYKVLIVGVEEINKRDEIIVSRARPEFLAKLFELEVPEISSDIVEVKAVAREVGSRSKVAVYTKQDGIDPVGSCIGQQGSRINAIMNELGGEKVDVILWIEEPKKFIANALSPAEIKKVEIVEGEDGEEAIVYVEDDQLSLTIGRGGQNVRLAAKLTNYKLTIKSPSLEGDGISDDEDQEEISEVTTKIKEVIDKKDSDKSKDAPAEEGEDSEESSDIKDTDEEEIKKGDKESTKDEAETSDKTEDTKETADSTEDVDKEDNSSDSEEKDIEDSSNSHKKTKNDIKDNGEDGEEGE